MKKLALVLSGIVIGLGIAFVLLHSSVKAPSATPTPSATPKASQSTAPQLNITVTSPKAGAMVSNPITVTGTERTFEQNVAWQLRALGGDVLASGNTTGHATDIGIFGPYSFTVTIPSGAPKNLEIVVFDRSAKDGSVIDQVVVPVVLK